MRIAYFLMIQKVTKELWLFLWYFFQIGKISNDVLKPKKTIEKPGNLSDLDKFWTLKQEKYKVPKS